MANEEQLAILRQGVEVWNQWRDEYPEIEIDLCSADLSDLHLRFVNLSNSDLSNTILSRANLYQADLSNANLFNAQLYKTSLYKANLSGANFRNASLLGANIKQAELIGADLHEAETLPICFNNSNLSQSNLSKADLFAHKFIEANLEGTDLKGANLEGANFQQATLQGAKLQGAKLYAANLSFVNLNDANLEGANLEGAQLCYTRCHSVNLARANLKSANLASANLYKANLEGADLQNANLSMSRLEQTNLGDANLSKVTGLGAKFLCSNLTGSCLKDWHISHETDFENVKSDYVYRGFDDKQKIFTDRLPVNSAQNFKNSEFEEWVNIHEKALKTIDLTFTEGIDWQAFFQSLEGVRQEYPNSEVGLQAVEKKGSAFVIRLETSPEADQGAIESAQKELYQTQLQLSEAQGQVIAYKNVIESMVIKMAEANQVTQNFNEPVANVAGINEGEMKPEQYNNQTTVNAQTVGVMHTGSGDIKDFTQNIYNQADEIAQLLDSLKQLANSFPGEHSNIAEQQEIIEGEIEDIEDALKNPENHSPKYLGRRVKALKRAGKAVLALAGTAVVAGSTFAADANKFLENVDQLGEKIGIEVIRDK